RGRTGRWWSCRADRGHARAFLRPPPAFCRWRPRGASARRRKPAPHGRDGGPAGPEGRPPPSAARLPPPVLVTAQALLLRRRVEPDDPRAAPHLLQHELLVAFHPGAFLGDL